MISVSFHYHLSTYFFKSYVLCKSVGSNQTIANARFKAAAES